MRSAFAAAWARGCPRSMAPRCRASAIAASELTPRISPLKPAFLRARPKDPPINPTPTMATVCNSNAPAHRRRNQAKLPHQLAELFRIERLRAVAQRVVRIVVDLDEQPVRAGGYRGSRHGSDLIAASSAMRWIAYDGQMGELLHHRDGGDIHGIARVRFEGADAALAEDDLVCRLLLEKKKQNISSRLK